MISIEDISSVLAPLDDEQRALVMDFARMLQKRGDLRVPDEYPLSGPEADAWRDRIGRHAARVLDDDRRSVEALGLPAEGDISSSEWPIDMLASSKTTVDT